MTILKNIADFPIIAVLRNLPEDQTLKVIESLLEGGVHTIEVTFGENNPAQIIKAAKNEFQNDVFVGAGTVLNTEHVKIAVDAGAQFAFSPIYSKEVVRLSLENDIISIPGCYSPTEIYEAHQLGAQAIKVFPATALGPNFIKDIKAPMPFLNIIPTGGINKDNIVSYFDAGALAVGLGSSLVNKEMVESNNFNQITLRAKELINLINKAV